MRGANILSRHYNRGAFKPLCALSVFAVMSFGVLIGAPQQAAANAAQTYRVDLNKTQILRLPAAAGSIIIGNPKIADVTVHTPDVIFVVGRGFGETNLVILDRSGATMMDADIQVTAITPPHGIRLHNGGLRQTYSCTPYCQPSPILGDSPEFIGANSPDDTGSGLQGSIVEGSSATSGTEFVDSDIIAGAPVDVNNTGGVPTASTF